MPKREARPEQPGSGGRPPLRRPTRTRLSAEDREKMIVEGAIKYFATYGFDGETRSLARSIGVSQALIFHYFPTKDALIDRVYNDVFIRRWKDAWADVIGDRARPLRDRLKAFYRDYFATADSPDWIRITLFSALRDIDINARYHQRVRDRIIGRIADELRFSLGMGAVDPDLAALHEQVVYTLHAGLIYALIRKHVYHLETPVQADVMIDIHVDMFMNSVEQAMRSLCANRPRPARPSN